MLYINIILQCKFIYVQLIYKYNVILQYHLLIINWNNVLLSRLFLTIKFVFLKNCNLYVIFIKWNTICM